MLMCTVNNLNHSGGAMSAESVLPGQIIIANASSQVYHCGRVFEVNHC